MLGARVRSVLIPPTSHIASLNRHTPKFSGVGLKLALCQLFAAKGLPKSQVTQFVSTKKGDFEVFFLHKIDFP